MDPDEALRELRRLIEDSFGAYDKEDAWESLDEARHQFKALDEWLSKGGFLPSDWRR